MLNKSRTGDAVHLRCLGRLLGNVSLDGERCDLGLRLEARGYLCRSIQVRKPWGQNFVEVPVVRVEDGAEALELQLRRLAGWRHRMGLSDAPELPLEPSCTGPALVYDPSPSALRLVDLLRKCPRRFKSAVPSVRSRRAVGRASCAQPPRSLAPPPRSAGSSRATLQTPPQGALDVLARHGGH